jgi:hypothetical protein
MRGLLDILMNTQPQMIGGQGIPNNFARPFAPQMDPQVGSVMSMIDRFRNRNSPAMGRGMGGLLGDDELFYGPSPMTGRQMNPQVGSVTGMIDRFGGRNIQPPFGGQMNPQMGSVTGMVDRFRNRSPNPALGRGMGGRLGDDELFY